MITKVSPVNFGNSNFEYAKLENQDITRLPYNVSGTLTSKKTPDKLDSFESQDLKEKRSRFLTWAGILAFVGIGLLAARKYNWFSPVKRELKKISEEKELFTKTKAFIDQNSGDEVYKSTIKGLLSELKENKSVSDKDKKIVQEILEDKNQLEKFLEKSVSKLKSESDNDKLKIGFAIDIIEKFADNIKEFIKVAKTEGKKVSDEHVNIIDKLFEKKSSNEPSIVETKYKELIGARISSVIKEFIFDKV